MKKGQGAQLIIWIVALAIVSGVVIYIIKSRKNDQSEKDFFEDLDEAISKLEEMRLRELQAIKELHIISQLLAEQEAERLKQKLGKEHPRVLKLLESIEYHKCMISHLEDSVEIAYIKVPEEDDECGE